MTTLDQMWERLAQHQPKADELGYGKAWKRMCEERTEDAADRASEAAADAAWRAGKSRADAAYAAMDAALSASDAAWRAERAIKLIEKAEGK